MMNRREFVKGSFQAAAAAVGGVSLLSSVQATAAPTLLFTQIPLPYAFHSLEPYIDRETMEIHYAKHHAAYIKNVNEEIAAKGYLYNSETEFFGNIAKMSDKARNNGGGAWNHNFFWQVMKPGSSQPPGKVADSLAQAFGSVDKFKEQFTAAGMSRFGSGWAWLVNDNGKLKIGSTANQDNPMMSGAELRGTPLLALDVWEHAYYLKYQNKRADYISNWWSVVSWDEVAKRLV